MQALSELFCRFGITAGAPKVNYCLLLVHDHFRVVLVNADTSSLVQAPQWALSYANRRCSVT